MFCTRCGTAQTTEAIFCAKCGQRITSNYSDNWQTQTMERAIPIENSFWHVRQTLRDIYDSKESLGMFVSCLALIAIFQGSALIAPGLDRVLISWLGVILLTGIAFGVLLKLIFDRRIGRSLSGSLLELGIFGLLTYASIYGSFWFVKEQWMKPGVSPFSMIGLPMPTQQSGGALATARPSPTLQQSVGAMSSVTSVQPIVRASIATANLTLRSGPGKTFSDLGAYPEGTSVVVLDKDNDGAWLKVKAPDGQVGWMSATFLRLIPSP